MTTPEGTADGPDVAALTPEQQQRFTHAADAALRVRRNILLLAAHASGHMKHPHGESCEECKERWPCVAVMRAAGPSLNAVADLPSGADRLAAVTAQRDQEREAWRQAVQDAYMKGRLAGPPDPDKPGVPDDLNDLRAALRADRVQPGTCAACGWPAVA